jgi:hypothetical protein
MERNGTTLLFYHNTSSQSSGGKCSLRTQSLLTLRIISAWVCKYIHTWTQAFNALMIKAAHTSETSVNVCQTTRCNNPQDSHLHTRRHDNLKSPSFMRLTAKVKWKPMRGLETIKFQARIFQGGNKTKYFQFLLLKFTIVTKFLDV